MKDQIRNICITDIKSVEEYLKVCELCEGKKSELNPAQINILNGVFKYTPYLFDNNNCTSFMHFWDDQEENPNFENCKQITYAEFINKYNKKETTDVICVDTDHWIRATDYCKLNGLVPMDSVSWNLALEKTKPLPELAVDTKVIVQDSWCELKYKRYFSHFDENGKICTFIDGSTSWSNNGVTVAWDIWELAND